MKKRTGHLSSDDLADVTWGTRGEETPTDVTSVPAAGDPQAGRPQPLFHGRGKERGHSEPGISRGSDTGEPGEAASQSGCPSQSQVSHGEDFKGLTGRLAELSGEGQVSTYFRLSGPQSLSLLNCCDKHPNSHFK